MLFGIFILQLQLYLTNRVKGYAPTPVPSWVSENDKTLTGPDVTSQSQQPKPVFKLVKIAQPGKGISDNDASNPTPGSGNSDSGSGSDSNSDRSSTVTDDSLESARERPLMPEQEAEVVKKTVYICLGVVALWLLIPIVWTAIEPPTELRRKCIGDLKGVFLVLYIIFNIALIIVTAYLARLNDDLDAVIHPIFIMILVSALFQPMSFMLSGAQFPDRRPIALALSPAVGVLLGTMLEAALLILPSLGPAIMYSPEEIALKQKLEREIREFHKEFELEMHHKHVVSKQGTTLDKVDADKSKQGGDSENANHPAKLMTSPSSRRLQRLRSRLSSGNLSSSAASGGDDGSSVAVEVVSAHAHRADPVESISVKPGGSPEDSDEEEEEEDGDVKKKKQDKQEAVAGGAGPAPAKSVTEMMVSDMDGDDLGQNV